MSHALVQLCLSDGAIDGSLLGRLIANHDLAFEPQVVYCDRVRGGAELRYDDAALAQLATAGAIDSAGVRGAGGLLELGGIGGHTVDQLVWTTSDPPGDLGLIDAVAGLPGFNAAYLSDGDDTYWQSEDSIEAYERAGRRHDHLPKVEGGFFPGEDEEIDVSQNPGRQVPLDGLWLFAASQMWFGAGAFELLDRDRLLDLPVGEVTERADGTVHVDLFPWDWYADAIDEVRDRQRRFRDWMQLDELEARADELEARTADPKVEIETGTFPNGGVRRFTEWLDAAGVAAVPKSRARRRRVIELSERGEVVWREESDVA